MPNRPSITACQAMANAEHEEVVVALRMLGEAVRSIALVGAFQLNDNRRYFHVVPPVALARLRAWSGGAALGIEAEARVTALVMSAVENLLKLAEADAVACAEMRRQA